MNLLTYLKVVGDVVFFAKFQKRDLLAPAKGIGAWNAILEMICFFSTIGNVGFVYFCSRGLTIFLGKEQDDNGDVDNTQTYLRNIYICVAVEHLLLIIKFF